MCPNGQPHEMTFQISVAKPVCKGIRKRAKGGVDPIRPCASHEDGPAPRPCQLHPLLPPRGSGAIQPKGLQSLLGYRCYLSANEADKTALKPLRNLAAPSGCPSAYRWEEVVTDKTTQRLWEPLRSFAARDLQSVFQPHHLF